MALLTMADGGMLLQQGGNPVQDFPSPPSCEGRRGRRKKCKKRGPQVLLGMKFQGSVSVQSPERREKYGELPFYGHLPPLHEKGGETEDRTDSQPGKRVLVRHSL